MPEPANPPKIFDRDLIARHLASRAPGVDDFVARLVRDDLAERLYGISRTFKAALALAPAAPFLPDDAMSGGGPVIFERSTTALAAPGLPLLDPARLSLQRNDYDLIVSLVDLQIIDDVPGFLLQLARHLRPDGLLLMAALGGNSLTELRSAFLAADAEMSGGAYARVAPFIDVRDAGALLQRAGLALPVSDIETHVVRYSDALALMRELKALGASNPLADRPSRLATPQLLLNAARHYHEAAADPDGRVRATLEIVWMSGWSPHASQQQPLKPGSAKVSLKDALGKL